MESVHDPWVPGHAPGRDPLMRLFLVSGLTLVVWAYGTLWDLSVARYYGSLTYSWGGEHPGGAADFLLQHAVLLPAFALAYHLAAGIFRQGGRYGWLIAKQALLLLVFVCLVRPDLLLAERLVGGEGPAGGFLAQLNERHAWFHTAVSYSLIYFVGLCSLFGVSMLMRSREQQHAAALKSDGLRSRNAALARRLELHALDDRGMAARLTIKVGRTARFMDMTGIESIEADGDYLNIHCASGERHRTRETLASLESVLPSRHFARIRRSTLVNLSRVKEVRSDKHGRYIVVMTGGRVLVTGAKYVVNIQRLLRR